MKTQRRKFTQKSSQANRGMEFEGYIMQANARYAIRGIAAIDKIPTPIKVLKLATAGPKKGRIIDGYFEEKSTVDFVGVSRGRSIFFDAKETDEASFPLKNVEEHQFEALRDKHSHQAISFLLVRLKKHNDEIYILLFEDLDKWWKETMTGGRKSIPYQFFKENCVKCEPGRNVAIDYMAALDKATMNV
ncbi:Holliday junction resolvase RecU [Priestia megaterium]|uniref:Holliday junction resolvase RecU n=1 Tax=Priestia megaterium TaxID=1404 RepID=UPI0025AF421A|nr:Holliday junction resolvase RecU [Priestia megaterium]MDN3365394.1 Holliday junction resolvase RecU [Priestia megaterium]